MTRTILAVALAFAAALPAPASASVKQGAPVRIGIGDQKTQMFSDQRFKDLGIRLARMTVPWDALNYDWQRAELEDWLFKARAAHVDPLITFTHSRVPGDRRVLPTNGQFAYYFHLFRQRYPWVKTFAAWNEANHCGEPTCKRVDRVVAYYKVMRHQCPSCKVLAAELLDFPNMTAWVKEFQRRAHVDPKYWGLHNYRDANRLQTINTRKLLKATRGRIWLTETGGIVARRNKSAVSFEESPQHAAIATRWVFDRIVPLSSRIERVYLYDWNASTPYDTWDSALVGPDGKSRPAMRVLQRVLDFGIRPPAGISRVARS
jgi:polysaccharide biosynthesis protein PslG